MSNAHAQAQAQVSPDTIAFLISKGVPMSQILPLLQGAPQVTPSVPQVETPAPKKRGRKLGSKNKPKAPESIAPAPAAPAPIQSAPVAQVLPPMPQGFYRSKSGSVSLAIDYLTEVKPNGGNPKGTVFLKGPRVRRLKESLKGVGVSAECLSELERIATILDTLNPSK